MRSMRKRLSVYLKPQIAGLILAALIALYFIYRCNHPLFHFMNVAFDIIVTSMICVITVKTFQYSRNNLLLFIGHSFLFITILNFAYLTTFPGTASATSFNLNLRSFFITLVEYLYVVMLATAPFYIQAEPPHKALFGIYLTITAGFISMLIWPHAFIAGAVSHVDLAFFKNISGFIIFSIVGVALIHLFLRRKHLNRPIYRSMLIFIGLTALSEIRFIFYRPDPNLINFLGEVFHTASYLFISRIVIALGIENPYDFINELKECAIHDPLTGIFNRKGLLEFTKKEVARYRREGITMGVMLMDVDRFKSVNDRHGHMIGDQVLIKFADILKTVVRESDLVCRLGGDEFVLIMNGNMKDLHLVRMRIIEAVERWRAMDKVARKIGVSIGCALWDPANPDQADIDLDHLLDLADQEMYREKMRKKALGTADKESQLQIFNLL